MNGDYTLCGWRVRSELALPELLPWTGESREPDVVITISRVIPPATPPIHTLPFSQIWPDGGYLFTLETVGRYWVASGKTVVIEPVENAREADLRVFLLGTVFGVLCHQRRLLPLHASAVRMGMGAVVMAGDCGVGKSTLAAGLLQRGYPLVAGYLDVRSSCPHRGRPWASHATPGLFAIDFCPNFDIRYSLVYRLQTRTCLRTYVRLIIKNDCGKYSWVQVTNHPGCAICLTSEYH